MRLRIHNQEEHHEHVCIAAIFLFLIVVGSGLCYYGTLLITPLHTVAQLGSAPL